MNPLRLAIVTETYVPDVNGVANSLRQLLLALDPEHFRIQIIRTRPRSEWVSEHEEVWCRGLTIPMYPDLQLGLPCARRIRRVWESFSPDIVYIATEGPMGLSALKEARRRGLPVISAFHTNFHRYSGYYGMGWIRTLTLNWLRRFHNQTAVTLVPSSDIAADLREQNFHPVEVLSHGVDCRLFNPRRRQKTLRDEWQAGEQDKVLLYVGRIAAEKNIPLAIRSWQQLRHQHPRLKLVMVGDGPLRAQLAAEYPDIIFAGVQTGERLAQYFASADAFIFPSLTETFGLVTLEAMASGLPVVAFNMAAAALHVCPGGNGELAQGTGDEEFIAAASRLLALDLKTAGKKAREEAESASWDAVAVRFEAIVRALLSKKNQRVQSEIHKLV